MKFGNIIVATDKGSSVKLALREGLKEKIRRVRLWPLDPVEDDCAKHVSLPARWFSWIERVHSKHDVVDSDTTQAKVLHETEKP